MKTRLAFIHKYKPQSFEEMVGIRHLIPQIEYIVKTKVYNGLLAIGPHGNGKTTLLELLWVRSCCQNPDGINPCLKCEYCSQIKGSEGAFDGYKCYGHQLHQAFQNTNNLNLATGPMDLPVRSVFIDDVDAASGKDYEQLMRILNRFRSNPILFTATKTDHLPEAFRQRCLRLPLTEYNEKNLILLIERIANAEKREIDLAVAKSLIELADYIPRVIVRGLEIIFAEGDLIDETVLHSPLFRSNLS